MPFTSRTSSDGVTEQLFTLGEIPGVLWTPEDAIGARPLILMGHGGGQHKKAPRVRAAVLGLLGVHGLGETAARVSAPVEFLLQWDDDLVPRAEGLALFDALASAEKTLHANPGKHGEIPGFETDSSLWFFSRHLARADYS